jgi:hypothetical protein
MNLFRSEEHVSAWLGARPQGMTLPVSTLAALARDWWGDRLDAGWRPHSREQNQAILDGLGLTDPFWRLP